MERPSHTLAAIADERLEERGLKPDDVDHLLSPEDELGKKQRRPRNPVARRRKKGAVTEPGPGKFKQLSFWVSKEEYFALRQASLARQEAGDEPYRQEHMTRLAFRAYLQDLGFLRKGAA